MNLDRWREEEDAAMGRAEVLSIGEPIVSTWGDESGTNDPDIRFMMGYLEHKESMSYSDYLVTVRQTAEACLKCMEQCFGVIAHSHPFSPEVGVRRFAGSERLFVDCWELCSATARLCRNVSPRAGVIAQVCADSCYDCIVECESLYEDEGGELLRACRDCYKMCRDLAKTSRKKWGPRAGRYYRRAEVSI